MLSGDRSLMAGYLEFSAIDAANADFPEPGGPYNSILNTVDREDVRT